MTFLSFVYINALVNTCYIMCWLRQTPAMRRKPKEEEQKYEQVDQEGDREYDKSFDTAPQEYTYNNEYTNNP